MNDKKHMETAIAAIRMLMDHAYEHGFHEMGYDPLADVVAELDRLEADARRYQWARSQGGSWETEAFLSGLTPEQYDAAIDKAMKEGT